MGHARLAASNTKVWATCPGQVPSIEYLFEPGHDPSGELAMLGTCAHALSERCLQEGSEPSEYEGRYIVILDVDTEDEGVSILRKGAKTPKGSNPWFIVDQDMWEAVELMTGYVRRRCDELGLIPEGADQAKAVAGLIQKGVVRLEEKVNPLPSRNDTGGSSDVVIDAWPVILEVIDYKHGAFVGVPVEKNHQARSYALGEAELQGFDHETYRYTIVQPRHADYRGPASEEMTADELKAWGEWLATRAARVDDASEMWHSMKVESDPDDAILQALFNAGLLDPGEDGSVCKYCKLKTFCPGARKAAENAAMADFDDDDPTSLADAKELASKDNLEGEELFALLKWVPFLEDWTKAVKAEALQRALEGNMPSEAGYKIVHGRSNREWDTVARLPDPENENEDIEVELTSDEDRAKAIISLYGDQVKGGLSALMPKRDPALLTGPQAEKLVPKAMRGDFSRRFMHKPPGKPALVPESDPKPAIDKQADAAADFPEED